MPDISYANTMLDAKALRQQAREARKKNMRESWHRFAKNKVALAGLIVILLLVILAVIAPYIAPYKYDKIDPIHSYQPPSKEHLFGTDGLGRDLFSRVLYGTRYSLAIAFASQLVGIRGCFSCFFRVSFLRIPVGIFRWTPQRYTHALVRYSAGNTGDSPGDPDFTDNRERVFSYNNCSCCLNDSEYYAYRALVDHAASRTGLY